MVNYAIDSRQLAEFVPAGTELDLWHGQALVSLVGFMFYNCRLRGVRIPLHQQFEELNLRLYVRRRHAGEWRRGVAFIREIVPRAAVAAIARWAYGERYIARPMRHEIVLPTLDHPTTANNTNSSDRGFVSYGFRQGSRWNTMAGDIHGDAAAPESGSIEEFITEHYWGYTARGATRTSEYAVAHAPWRVWPVTRVEVDRELAASYGPTLGPVLAAEPDSALVADGSAVSVYCGTMIDAEAANEQATFEQA